MTQLASPLSTSPASAYAAGACNIGAAEIGRRRMAGHIGLAVTAGLLAILVASGAPHLLRLILFVPAMASAVGYLQARLRFCAAFGSGGGYNFGPLGQVVQVSDPAARRRDLVRSLQIFGGSVLIGAVVAIVAVLLPF